jgi:hypothetical protein
MSSLAMKRAVATALAGAALASAIGATGASARPVEQFIPSSAGATAESPSLPPPPSSIAASAGKAYEGLRSPGQPVAQPTGEPQPVVDEPTSPSGFDLLSAAIGVAAGAGFVIVLLAAGGLARRRPLTRKHGTIGA